MIIVIAIMAILIGVIALAVIPNIQRSRESKDLTTLDNILSAANTAVANARITDDATFTLPHGSAYACPNDGTGGGPTGFKAAFDESMAGTITLGSKNAKDQDITIKLSGGRIEVYIAKTGGEAPTGATDGVAVAKCEYTKGDDGTSDALFYVTN